MTLHFIYSNSNTYSNSMNFNSPSMWITFKFEIACCAIYFRKSLLHINQRNFPLYCCYGCISGNSFFQIFDKIYEIIFNSKTEQRCAWVVYIQGPMNQFYFDINTHTYWQRNYTCPWSVWIKKKKKWDSLQAAENPCLRICIGFCQFCYWCNVFSM